MICHSRLGNVTLTAAVAHEILPAFGRVRTRSIDIERYKPLRELQDLLDASNPPLGLKWKSIGSTMPTRGQNLTNDELSRALQSNTTFTQEEWDTLGVTSLHADDCIKSGNSYFQPVEVPRWVKRFDGSGSLEITTSKEILVELTAASEFTGPVFLPPVMVRLRPVNTSKKSLYSNNSFVNKNRQLETISFGSTRLVVRLPSFHEACQEYEGYTGEDCMYGLELSNAKDPTSAVLAGSFACPPLASSARDCLPGMYAVNSPAAGRFVVRYVEKCVDAKYLDPGDPACLKEEAASQCAYGRGDDCQPCPQGAGYVSATHCMSIGICTRMCMDLCTCLCKYTYTGIGMHGRCGYRHIQACV